MDTDVCICGFKVRHWRTLTCVVLVVAASWGARQIAAAAWKSVVGYRTPYTFHQTLPPGTPLARRVILIVLDGVRLDLSQRMPFLNSLRRQGADGVAVVGQPSLSNPGRAVMVTGAWQEVHGVTFNSGYNPITVDTVFSLARTAGMKTAVSGSGFWQTNFGPLGAETFPRYPKELHGAAPEAYVEYQKRTCADLPALVRNSPAQFLALDLNAMDDASHDLGPLSEGAAKVLLQVDRCLQDVAGAVDLRDTVLVATSDHGHIDTGGHGGTEEQVIRVPLVISGGPVHSGVRLQAQQTDIAPTICALLGLPFPATNQGRVLLETLDVPLQLLEPRLKEQVAAFRAFQTHLLGEPPEEARAHDQRNRMLPAVTGSVMLLALCTGLLFAVLLDSQERRGALAGLAAFYVVYFGLFKLAGLAYSFSAVNREEYLPEFFLKNMLAAGAALAVAAFVTGWLIPACGLPGRPRIAAALTTLVIATVALQLMAIYWINGIFMTYWMLDLSWGIQAYFALLAIHALGFAMLLTPLTLYAGQRLRSRTT